MPIDPEMTKIARERALMAARSLLTEAAERVNDGDNNAADALVVAVLRVLDGYEAIAQLPDAHDIARTPDTPIPFRPVR